MSKTLYLKLLRRAHAPSDHQRRWIRREFAQRMQQQPDEGAPWLQPDRTILISERRVEVASSQMILELVSSRKPSMDLTEEPVQRLEGLARLSEVRRYQRRRGGRPRS